VNHHDGTIELSLIIPAFNEEERIAQTLDMALAYLDEEHYPWELIVVDDGSRDRTLDVVATYAPRVQCLALVQNRGKGAAVRTGMLAARGTYRVFTDADLSTPIEELGKMRAAFERGADVVIGSRRLAPGLIKKTSALVPRTHRSRWQQISSSCSLARIRGYSMRVQRMHCTCCNRNFLSCCD